MIYTMRYKGSDMPDSARLKDIFQSNNITVLDGSALPKMAKVEIPVSGTETLPALREEWDLYPEKMYKVPTTRRSVKK